MSRDSLLWHVRAGDVDIWLLGTIHLYFEGVEVIIAQLRDHFQANRIDLYLGETDMDALVIGQSGLTVRDEVQWSDRLTPAAYRRWSEDVRQHCGLELDHYSHVPPLLINSVLYNALMRTNKSSLDERLWRMAVSMQVPTTSLEPIDRQIEIYESMTMDYQMIAMKTVLRRLSHARRMLLGLIETYRSQSIHQLYRQTRRSLGQMRHVMINQRNMDMYATLISMLNDPQISSKRWVVGVGAAHLAGEHGLLHLLGKAGYTVRPVDLRIT